LYTKGCGDGSDCGLERAPDYGSELYRYGIKSIHSLPIYIIDDIQTIITSIRGNVAKGKILNDDLTTTPCFIVKQGDKFAHGKTLREAQVELKYKLMPIDERINAFVDKFANGEKYSAREFNDWYSRLTGSSTFTHKKLVRDRGIDLDSNMTVNEFIQLMENEYGSDIIRTIKARYM